jgi:hypothetical protein
MSGDRIALRSDSKVVILRKSFDAQNLAWKVVRVIEVCGFNLFDSLVFERLTGRCIQY